MSTLRHLNSWGIAAVIAMLAVLPVGFATAGLSGGNTPSSDVAGLSVMLVAISCGVIASKRGSRWWLVVPVLTTLWACLVVLQMVVGE
jgi:hypothetical protein